MHDMARFAERYEGEGWMLARTDTQDPADGRGDVDDAGLTLVELLVAGMITTIVLAAAVSLMIGMFSTHGLAAGKSDSTLGARNFNESISRTIRVATLPSNGDTPFVVAKPDELSFYASLQRTGTQDALHPTLVRYFYDAKTGCLRESQVPVTITNGVGQYIPATAVEKCVARTSAAPVFEYYADGREVDDAGTRIRPLTATGGGVPVKTGAKNCASDAQDTRCIISVRVVAKVVAEVGSKERPTAVDFRVTLSNKFFGPQSSPAPSSPAPSSPAPSSPAPSPSTTSAPSPATSP